MEEPATITISWDSTLANNIGIRRIYYVSTLTGLTTHATLNTEGSIKVAKGQPIVISFHYTDPEVNSDLRLYDENDELLDEHIGMINNDILLFYKPEEDTELKMMFDDYEEEYCTYTWKVKCVPKK